MDATDRGARAGGDRGDLARRWIPRLAAALVLCACKAPERPAASGITIELVLPGAPAELLEQTAVLPVEEAVAPIARAIESRIAGDHATVRVAVGDAERAAEEVLRALPVRTLPPELEPPVIRKTRWDDTPVIWLEVGGGRPLAELSQLVRDEIVPSLAAVPGVGEIETRGLATRTTVVRPDLDRLAATGVVLFEVLAVLQAPSPDLSQVGDLVVRQADGAPIRLRELAVVEERLARDGTDVPTLDIYPRAGAEATDVVARVRAVIARPPPGVTVAETALPAKRRPELVLELRGQDPAELRAAGDAITARLAAHGIRDVVRDPPGEAEEVVVPELDRAAELGVATADVIATLRAIGGTRVGSITVELPRTPLRELLDRVRVRGAGGAVVPLSAIVSVKLGDGQAILRRGRERTIELAVDAPGARAIVESYPLPRGVRAMLSP